MMARSGIHSVHAYNLQNPTIKMIIACEIHMMLCCSIEATKLRCQYVIVISQ